MVDFMFDLKVDYLKNVAIALNDVIVFYENEVKKIKEKNCVDEDLIKDLREIKVIIYKSKITLKKLEYLIKKNNLKQECL